jgi:N utilization substance protein B
MPSRYHREPIPLRRIARKYVLQYLYQLDVAGAPEKPEIGISLELAEFWVQAEELHERLAPREWRKTKPLVERYIAGIAAHRDDIDETIEGIARNWSLERMAVVDRNILRIAVYELYYCPDVPPAVAINEAVDLAKGYGAAESGRFVNGILDQARRRRPALPTVPEPGPTPAS